MIWLKNLIKVRYRTFQLRDGEQWGRTQWRPLQWTDKKRQGSRALQRRRVELAGEGDGHKPCLGSLRQCRDDAEPQLLPFWQVLAVRKLLPESARELAAAG